MSPVPESLAVAGALWGGGAAKDGRPGAALQVVR